MKTLRSVNIHAVTYLIISLLTETQRFKKWKCWIGITVALSGQNYYSLFKMWTILDHIPDLPIPSYPRSYRMTPIEKLQNYFPLSLQVNDTTM